MKSNQPKTLRDAIILHDEKSKALLMPTDEEIINQFIACNGNMKQVAKKLECSIRFIKSMLDGSPEIKDAQEIGRTNIVNDIYSEYVSTVQTGFLNYYDVAENGELIKTKQKVDTGTRMFHMGKIVDMSKSKIGVVKEEVNKQVNNFIQVNMVDGDKLKMIESILKDDLQ
jgi:hypothetical protein